MEGIGNAGPDNVSNAKPQALPVSPLLRIPAEIREKVWSYVFEDTVIHYPPKAGYVPFENFCKRYAVTHACKWIHHEATSILASKSTLYITRRDVTYPDLPHCLRSTVLPYVRNMVVHDYRTVESALRVPLDLSPILAAAPSLTKVQIGHFHLHGQSRKYYSDLQSHVRILHDMIHGQASPEKRPNYARRQIHDFLDGVRLQDGPEREWAGAYRWLHDILLEKRPFVQVWISLGSSFMLMAPATLKDTHVAYLRRKIDLDTLQAHEREVEVEVEHKASHAKIKSCIDLVRWIHGESDAKLMLRDNPDGCPEPHISVHDRKCEERWQEAKDELAADENGACKEPREEWSKQLVQVS